MTPLFEAIRQTPFQGHQILELQRTPKRKPRQATLSVRYATLWLQPPQTQSSRLNAIAVQVVLAEEEQPPEGEKAVSWLLLTTLPVNSFEDACQCLRRYGLRWQIETSHSEYRYSEARRWRPIRLFRFGEWCSRLNGVWQLS